MSRFYHYDHKTGKVVEGRAPVEERTGDWPALTCFASGVHASQAQELRDYLRERGCPTEVTENGDPVYTSPAHRKKALKLRGMYDRDSFYQEREMPKSGDSIMAAQRVVKQAKKDKRAVPFGNRAKAKIQDFLPTLVTRRIIQRTFGK